MEYLPSEIKTEIIQAVFPDYIDHPTDIDPLWPFVALVKVPDPNHNQIVKRQVEIELSRDKNIAIVRAKTTKLSNLRFNIKGALTKEVPELLLETLSVIHDSFGPLSSVLLLLRLLRAAFDLSVIELSSTDGKVLIELFKFAKEEHIIKNDAFLSYMQDKVDMKDLYRSLNKLERLSCIERSDTNIHLIEEIITK